MPLLIHAPTPALSQQEMPRWRRGVMSLHPWLYLVHVALVLGLYVGTAKLGLSLHAVGGFATAVWPPAGLALVALVLKGYRLWPGIALGAYLVNLWAGAPWLVAAGMALGNTLEALLGAAFLKEVVRFRPALDRLRDVTGLIGAAALSTLVSATIGVTSGWLGGVFTTEIYGEAWWTWWLGDMNGDLVVAAMLLTWKSWPTTLQSSRIRLEGAGLVLGVVALALFVFDTAFARNIVNFSYLIFPVLIWTAIRLGPPGASLATAVVSAIAIWGTAHSRGPFVSGTLHENVLALQAFMSIVAGTLLILAAVVAERKRAEEAVRVGEESLRIALTAGQMGIWEWNIASGQVHWSAMLETIHGLAPGSFGGTFEAFCAGIHPDDRERVTDTIAETLAEGRDFCITYRIALPDSRVRWVEGRGQLFHDVHGTGRPVRMSGVCMDITARKQAEDRLKTSLREQEVLLREIHHRVKNNLQVISSLLSLQADFIEEPKGQAMFADCRNRIHSMALIYHSLSQSESITRIDFGAYLHALAADLFRAYSVDGERIRLATCIDTIPLTIDTAVPCALLVHELVSNCLKHAFPNGQGGDIAVTFRRLPDGKLQLQVRDSGVGLPDVLALDNGESFGFQLITILREQLHASIDVQRHPGTTMTITFGEIAFSEPELSR